MGTRVCQLHRESRQRNLVSVEVNHVLEEDYNATWLNMSGNITIEINQQVQDNPTDDKPGDYYISKAVFTLKR